MFRALCPFSSLLGPTSCGAGVVAPRPVPASLLSRASSKRLSRDGPQPGASWAASGLCWLSPSEAEAAGPGYAAREPEIGHLVSGLHWNLGNIAVVTGKPARSQRLQGHGPPIARHFRVAHPTRPSWRPTGWGRWHRRLHLTASALPRSLPQPPRPCSSASSVRPPLVPPAVGGISSPRPELPVGLSVCVSIVVSCPLAPWVQGLRFWPRAGVCWVPVWAEPRGGESVRGSSVQSVCWGSWAPPLPACGSQASPRGSR